ncbi:TLD domain-containing protein 2 [Momordica charantia]|uniref:Oxidation resistance protein 1 n=1 Tax=Momordica charantia TaxID=3673 RepID=A0A6J1C5F6_MOMCH|nr:TLD domain-containing protein 2 [Momordica charantia]
MGKHKQQSLRSRAVHFVSDITTVLLNPISDKPSARTSAHPQSHAPEDGSDLKDDSDLGSSSEQGSEFSDDGPDTSSFTAFLYSLLSSSESRENLDSDKISDDQEEAGSQPMNNAVKETVVKKSLFSRGKQSLGKALHHAARITGYRNQELKSDVEMKVNDAKFSGIEMMEKSNVKEVASSADIADISEPSLLLSEKTRSVLYASLPALVQGRKWLLLYSTWRHGISLSTLYRRSMLWSGLSLLVVGDRKGAVFGGLVEAPLKPSSKRKYQGTNNTFVFTNIPGHPVIYRPTGENHYFTLCSPDFLAIGGGSHFALYLDNDLLNGSSSISETYGNPCLANAEEFEVKEVELWGFVYTSKYEEMLALSRTEAPGICRW